MEKRSRLDDFFGVSTRGQIRFGTIVTLIVLTVIGYSAYKLVPPYGRYTQVKYLFKEQAARAKIRSADKIQRTIWGHFEEMETVWLDEDDLSVKINQGKVTIEATYEDVIDLPGGFEYSLWFNPSITAEIPKKDNY